VKNVKAHIIELKSTARDALRAISCLPDNTNLTLFVIDEEGHLKGTVTDGDIRRGLLNNLEISELVENFMNRNFKFLFQHETKTEKFKEYKKIGLGLVPILNSEMILIDIMNLKKVKAILPISALLMAGGKGERLKPLTDFTPKPMLKVGEKPIIEYNIDRLISYGVENIFISVKYMKEVIMDYFGDGSAKGIKITYIEEVEPLGTLGALSLIDEIEHNDLLVMNSDILTNIDFEDFYSSFVEENSDMMLASIPYNVAIPYAVLKTQSQFVCNFEEKPNYTYYSNGGIYFMKTKLKSLLHKGDFYNATDLMNTLIEKDFKKLTHFPLLGYWLDIGRHQDYLRAQEDVKHILL
jgi:dTDP-glucose pyrophosphorylase